MLLAAGTALLLLVLGVQMPPPPGRTEGYPLVIVVAPAMYAVAALLVTILSGIASWLVSRRAAHQSVVEALAHV
ncbi:MAG: ABC transporter permease, partial [Pseudomonadota bacterium]